MIIRRNCRLAFIVLVSFVLILPFIVPPISSAASSEVSPPVMEIENVALYKKVTSSVAFDNIGVITDGVISTDAGGYAQDWPEGGGLQWVQIDLGKMYDVSSVNIWRYWEDNRTYKDVVVQLSTDPAFEENVTTVFNNDEDNSAGLGKGTDEEYKETEDGKVIEFDTLEAKYVRVYSAGNEHNTNNHYVEIEVMGSEQLATEIPDTPTGYAYPMGTSRINASWDIPEGAYGFDVEVDGKVIENVDIPYGHTNLEEKATHSYRVRAKNHLGTSEWSEVFQGRTLANVEVGSRFMGPDPGKAQGVNEEDVYELSNSILSARFNAKDDTFVWDEFQDKMEKDIDPIVVNELFAFELGDGTRISDADFIAGKPSLTRIKGVTSAKVSDRYDGWKLEVPFTYTSGDKTLSVTWSATLRDESNYMIQDVNYTAEQGDWDIKKFQLINIDADQVNMEGKVEGSPFFAGQVFFAQQTPVAKGNVKGNSATAYVDRGEKTLTGESFKQSSVIGLYPGNQKQRAFQYYLERERGQEHKNFLHYNSWYDLSWVNDAQMTEDNALTTIKLYADKFIERGAPLKNFLFDDGYDDYSPEAENIWDFNKNTFPNGAKALKEATEKYNTTLGFWLSPTGGYYHKLPARIAIGKRKDNPYETKTSTSSGEEIFTLNGPNYYEGFKEAVTKKQLEEGTRHFKFDRTEGIEDFHAFLRLSEDMRENDPEVFINTTVGTWASPFFTLYIDSVWRGGGDMGLVGSGTNRQQWINYRDQVSRNLIKENPYYPLNSLMNHGIIHARFGQAAWVTHDDGTEAGSPLNMTNEDHLQDYKDEVWSYFASGYNLQELYIRPTSDYMTEEMWDILAEASAWADLNHNVLIDSHFIGGDPESEVYGIASYADTKAILMVRNPSDTEKSFEIDAKDAFLLPEDGTTDFQFVNKLNKEEADFNVSAETPHTITVPAHSIVLYEAYPDEDDVQIDKSALEAAITEAEAINLENYTDETAQAVAEKLDEAKAVAADKTASQETIDKAAKSLQDAVNALEEKQPEEISASDLKALVKELDEAGEIKESTTARALRTHLTAVGHYENKEEGGKVVKHMNGFKQLLDHQNDNKLISDKANEKLTEKADALINQWK